MEERDRQRNERNVFVDHIVTKRLVEDNSWPAIAQEAKRRAKLYDGKYTSLLEEGCCN